MRYTLNASSALAVVTLLFFSHSTGVFAQTTPTTSDKKAAILDGVRRGDYAAILEAGRTGDTNFISYLQGQITGKPSDPPTEAATMALAKLGVKKYLDETVAELTTTNSELFAFYMRNGICPYPSQERRVACATERTQETAFKKLAYIRDPSTVKVVAAFLYSTESFHFANDVPPWKASGFAILTLRQMVDNPPQTPVEFTREQDIHAWQQWWQQNKDKYP